MNEIRKGRMQRVCEKKDNKEKMGGAVRREVTHLIIFQCINGHLSRPLIGLWMYSCAVQHFYVVGIPERTHPHDTSTITRRLLTCQ